MKNRIIKTIVRLKVIGVIFKLISSHFIKDDFIIKVKEI